MRYCTNCGHRLGVGRYCTNCGARVRADATDSPDPEGDLPTLVRPGARPPVPAAPPPPPPAGPAPSSARYPLYADTVARPATTDPAPAAPMAYDGARSRSMLPWLAASLVLAVAAVTSGLLLLGSSDGDSDRSGPGADRGRAANPGDGPVGELEPAGVVVPDTAPASVDDAGTPVTFEAAHMLDADPRTCWRMAGDATGTAVVLRFDEPVTVTEVGLVNGYAKTDPPHDWYAGNRRITAVAWVFDDGTEVPQDLVEDTSLQTVAVDPIETTEIELRILEVSDPGSGPDGRDFTAISAVAINGR